MTSDTWYTSYDQFYDMNEEVRVDFSRYDNIIGFSNDGKYKNNKIVVKFANEHKYFWTIADEKGELLFEPLEVPVCEVDFVKFDGEYVLIYDRSNYGSCNLQCYNSNGEKLGELTINESIKDTGNISISDGVISLKVGNTYSLYTTKFETLF